MDASQTASGPACCFFLPSRANFCKSELNDCLPSTVPALPLPGLAQTQSQYKTVILLATLIHIIWECQLDKGPKVQSLWNFESSRLLKAEKARVYEWFMIGKSLNLSMNDLFDWLCIDCQLASCFCSFITGWVPANVYTNSCPMKPSSHHKPTCCLPANIHDEMGIEKSFVSLMKDGRGVIGF